MVAPSVRERIRVEETHTFVGGNLRSGMDHGTHCKCHGPWRRAGVGSFGFFCCPQVVMVEGDLAPIGEACVRKEVVRFFGGDMVDGRFWKVAQVFGYVACLVSPDHS